MGERKAELRSAQLPRRSRLCPWASHTQKSRMLVLPGEQTQSAICLSFAGGSGSLARIYYELCSKKASIELCNTKEVGGHSGSGCGLECLGQRKQEDTRTEDSKHATMTVGAAGVGVLHGTLLTSKGQVCMRSSFLTFDSATSGHLQ